MGEPHFKTQWPGWKKDPHEETKVRALGAGLEAAPGSSGTRGKKGQLNLGAFTEQVTLALSRNFQGEPEEQFAPTKCHF